MYTLFRTNNLDVAERSFKKFAKLKYLVTVLTNLRSDVRF